MDDPAVPGGTQQITATAPYSDLFMPQTTDVPDRNLNTGPPKGVYIVCWETWFNLSPQTFRNIATTLQNCLSFSQRSEYHVCPGTQHGAGELAGKAWIEGPYPIDRGGHAA